MQRKNRTGTAQVVVWYLIVSHGLAVQKKQKKSNWGTADHMVCLSRRNKRKAIGKPHTQWHTHGLYSTIFSPLFSLRRRLFPNGNYSFQAVITCFICSLTKAVGIYAACFICSLTKAVGKYAACFSTTGPAAHDCELWTWF